MKKSPIALAVSAALFSVPAVAIEISDYVEVETTYEEAYVTVDASTQSGNQDQMSYDASALIDYERNYSSRQRNFNVKLDGDYSVVRGGNDNDEKNDTYSMSGSATVDNYLANNPNVFWYASGETAYQDQYDEIYAQVGGGMGYGRVTVATPLAYAVRIVEELYQHNIVGANVSDNAYLALAQVVNRRNEFRSKYGAEEYEAAFISAIEQVMKEQGIAPNGLTASGFAHLRRVLFDENINIRKYGWLVRGGVGVVVNDYNGNSGDPVLNAEFEYAKPVGLAGQFINTMAYNAIWSDNDATNQKIINRMSYTHELSDRIDWVNLWNLTIDIPEGSADTVYSNTLTSIFRYYLTNRLNVEARVSLTSLEDSVDNNDNDDVDVSTFLGVRYRLR
jgi:hypothetical protein